MVGEPEFLPLSDSDLKTIAVKIRRTAVVVALALLIAVAVAANSSGEGAVADLTPPAEHTVYRNYPSGAVTDLDCNALDNSSVSRCSYRVDSSRCSASVLGQSFAPRCRLP